MSKYVQWITHKGKKILFMNGKGLDEAANLAAQEELKQEIFRDRSGPPVLVDLSKTAMTQKTANKSKELFKEVKAAGLPEAPSAVVGLNKLQKTVAQMFAREQAHYFDTLDEAKDWLVKEVDKRGKR